MTPPPDTASPGLFARLHRRLAQVLDGGRGVPAKGSEYVVGLDTREPQFMVPQQALTVKLPLEPEPGARWVWIARTFFELQPIAEPATETDAQGQRFSVWRFRTTGELGVCFLDFHLLDTAQPEAAPRQTFTLTVKIGRY